jgi:hypothetical protein
MQVRKLFFIAAFLLSCFPFAAQIKDLLVPVDSFPYNLKRSWRYIQTDDPAYAATNYHDASWKPIAPYLFTDSLDDPKFNGFAWFRLHFSIPPELINKRLVLDILHVGASEIYLDGLQVASYGKVSVAGADEERFNPEGVVLPVLLRDSAQHVLAVRYSNHKFKDFMKWDEFMAGFRITLDKDINQSYLYQAAYSQANIVLLSLGGFLFALTFIHIFFYFFYRRQKYHLYYSFFTFFFALFFFLPYFSINLNNPDITEPLGYFIPMVVPIYFISLASFTHYLVLEKLPRTFWLSVLTGLVILSGFIFKTGFNDIFYAILIFLVIHQSMSALKQGKKLQREGLSLIRWGFRIFITFLGVVGGLYFGAVFGIVKNFGINQNGIYLLLPGILSIPVSISLYMARNFATLNVSLEKKLAEVEELSAKNLEQEKEKQQILAEQNIMLEQKVKERTAEVVAQKETIEEKQREILDSIRYAKRIQMALLPSEQAIGKVLKLFRRE